MAMAHEFEGQEIAIDAEEAEEMHEAMDYAQHRATWDLVTSLVKWAIVQLAFLAVALYCFIIAGNLWAGLFFLVVGLLLIPGVYLFGPKRAA